jgi:hypothetical protein
VPSDALTQNEIDAANSVVLTELNSQGQPIFEWPATFALARAYLDQLERWGGLSSRRIASARGDLDAAEEAMGAERTDMLTGLVEHGYAGPLSVEYIDSSYTMETYDVHVQQVEAMAALAKSLLVERNVSIA